MKKYKELVVIVGTKGRKDTALISKEEYENLIENLYILNNSDWVKSISKGIKELQSGRGKKLLIKEAPGV